MNKNYTALLSTIVVAVFVMPNVMAQTSGQTEFSAAIESVLQITVADSAFDFGTIAADYETTITRPASGTANINVVCNSDLGYQFTVQSNNATGVMFSPTPSELTNPLAVTITSPAGNLLSGATIIDKTPTLIENHQARNNPGGTDYGASYSQHFVRSDPAGNFGITLTYGVTANGNAD